MPVVYPVTYLVLTSLSILFSFTNACLTAFNISQFMLFINAPIAGLTFIYHITLLILIYRRSLRLYVAPRLFVGSQWSNVVVLVLLVGLWAVSLGLAIDLVARGPDEASGRSGAEWDLGVQSALALLSGLQVISLIAFIWTAVLGRMKFAADARKRANQDTHGYFPPRSVALKAEESDMEDPSTPSFIQHKFASLPRLTIPEPIPRSIVVSTSGPNPLPKSLSRAKVKHSALPGWDFVIPEARPSLTTKTARSSQMWPAI